MNWYNSTRGLLTYHEVVSVLLARLKQRLDLGRSFREGVSFLQVKPHSAAMAHPPQ